MTCKPRQGNAELETKADTANEPSEIYKFAPLDPLAGFKGVYF